MIDKEMKEKIIILDVIPIKINKEYPSKEEMWTFKNDGVKKGIDRKFVIDYMIDEIRFKFQDSDVIIILENNKVIKIIGAIEKIQIDNMLGEKNERN